MMYLMRPDSVYKTSVIQPFNLNMDPVQVAQAQLDRWSAIAQATSVPTAGVQAVTSPSGLNGFGQPLAPIVGRRPLPSITPAGPRAQLPAIRQLPMSARQAPYTPSRADAMATAARLAGLKAPWQAALLHRLSYAFALQGQGQTAGALRAILRRVPIRGNDIQLVASVMTQLGTDLSLMNTAIAQAEQGR